MSSRPRRFAAILSASALLGGAGLTVAQAASTDSSPGSTTTTRPAGPKGSGGPIPTAALESDGC